MRIEEIYIAEFGLLHDVTIPFHPYFQVIEGENESGKTTVAAFIRYMLYGFSGKGEAGNLERSRRLSPNGRCARGRMTVTAKGHRYRIERQTTAVLQNGREAYRETAAIYDEESGLSVDTRLSAGEYILGVPENVYTSTAFLTDAAQLQIGSADMREAIEQIMFSGSERINVQQALDRLDEARRSLLHKNEKGGAIFELRKQANEVSAALEASHEASRATTALEASLTRARENEVEASENLKKLRELETAYRDLSLIRRYDALHALEVEADAARNEHARYRDAHTVNGYFPDNDYLNELSVHRSLTADAARQYAVAGKQLRRLESETSISEKSAVDISQIEATGGFGAVRKNASTLSRRHDRNTVVGILSLLASAVCAFFAIWALGENQALSIALFLITASLFASSAILFHTAHQLANALALLCRDYGTKNKNALYRRLHELETEREKDALRGHTLAAAKTVLENCRARCNDTVRDLSLLASRWGKIINPDDVSQSLDQVEKEVRACLLEEARLARHRDELLARVSAERKELAAYNEVHVRTLVSPAKRENLLLLEKEGRIGEIDRGIQFYSHQLEVLAKRIHDLEIEHAAKSALIGKPTSLAAKLSDLNEQINTLLTRHSAYVAAYDAIAAAGEQLRARIAPRLTDYARRLMKNATDGRHETLGITANLSLTVTDEEGTHSVSHLSGATMDDACIALRLALVDLLFGETPPICYDESFVHQDTDRTETLLRALHDIGQAEDKQQIIFTCHNREARLLEKIGAPHERLVLQKINKAH